MISQFQAQRMIIGHLSLSIKLMNGHIQTHPITEIPALFKQSFPSHEQELLQELDSLRQFLRNQLAINKVQEQKNKSFESDISLLKILCLEQNQKIVLLSQEIAELGKNSQSLFAEHQKDIQILEAHKRSKVFSKANRQSSIIERADSLISVIDLQMDKKYFACEEPVNSLHKKTINNDEEYSCNSIARYYRQLNEHLQNEEITNSLRDVLMKIGEELRNQSKPRESLKYYKQANEVCLKLTREQGSAQAEIVFWIASNMSELGYYDEAIRYYEQEIAIRQSFNEMSSEDIAATLNNIGHNYYRKHLHEKAAHFFQQAAEMQTSIKGKDDPQVALYLKNIAQVYFSQSNFKLAEKYCLQSLQIYKAIGELNTEYCAWCHYFLSVIYFRSGRSRLCVKHILLSGEALVLTCKKQQFKEMLVAVMKNGTTEEVVNSASEAMVLLFGVGYKLQW